MIHVPCGWTFIDDAVFAAAVFVTGVGGGGGGGFLRQAGSWWLWW